MPMSESLDDIQPNIMHEEIQQAFIKCCLHELPKRQGTTPDMQTNFMLFSYSRNG